MQTKQIAKHWHIHRLIRHLFKIQTCNWRQVQLPSWSSKRRYPRQYSVRPYNSTCILHLHAWIIHDHVIWNVLSAIGLRAFIDHNSKGFTSSKKLTRKHISVRIGTIHLGSLHIVCDRWKTDSWSSYQYMSYHPRSALFIHNPRVSHAMLSPLRSIGRRMVVSY